MQIKCIKVVNKIMIYKEYIFVSNKIYIFSYVDDVMCFIYLDDKLIAQDNEEFYFRTTSTRSVLLTISMYEYDNCWKDKCIG